MYTTINSLIDGKGASVNVRNVCVCEREREQRSIFMLFNQTIASNGIHTQQKWKMFNRYSRKQFFYVLFHGIWKWNSIRLHTHIRRHWYFFAVVLGISQIHCHLYQLNTLTFSHTHTLRSSVPCLVLLLNIYSCNWCFYSRRCFIHHVFFLFFFVFVLFE